MQYHITHMRRFTEQQLFIFDILSTVQLILSLYIYFSLILRAGHLFYL